ncbi:MAG: hypothetical protein JSV68_03365 [Anaerolineaceae bacterium]|nr:MAG: hypothetical protein JSV68_03365 [Anaerolineaceae bacterium]
MPETLLRTKLFVPPLRPNLIPRPHLIKQLNRGLQLGHLLTLISAPAGFGKTTIAGDWVRSFSQTGTKIAWLSLDTGDNESVRFLTYLLTALNEIEGLKTDFGKKALGILQSPQASPGEPVLGSLINDVAAIGDSIILVLDDYDIIDSSLIDDALTFFLEHLSPH